MRFVIRFLFFAVLLACAHGCDPSKEEPAPDKGPDPDKIKLPGDDIKLADLITSEIYKNLVIEVAGYPLSGRAISNLQFFLQQRIQKSKIIIRSIKNPPAINVDSLSLGHLKQYEKENRTRSVVGDTVYVWIESLNARSLDVTKGGIKLAHTYGRSSIAIFARTLNDLTVPDMISRFTLESYVLQHEFSHLLGLVNGGTSMQTPHQDEAHGNHCTNPKCLMYWIGDQNIEFIDLSLGMNLGNFEVVPALDANCLADLKAAGGK